MRLDVLVKLKYESSTIILFVFCFKYSMRDLLSDLNNYAWRANWRYASDKVAYKWCQRFLWHEL